MHYERAETQLLLLNHENPINERLHLERLRYHFRSIRFGSLILCLVHVRISLQLIHQITNGNFKRGALYGIDSEHIQESIF